MTRGEIFDRLHEAHAHKWMFGPTKKGAAHLRFLDWRREWWQELERAFPDMIKNGVVIRGQYANSKSNSSR